MNNYANADMFSKKTLLLLKQKIGGVSEIKINEFILYSSQLALSLYL